MRAMHVQATEQPPVLAPCHVAGRRLFHAFATFIFDRKVCFPDSNPCRTRTRVPVLTASVCRVRVPRSADECTVATATVAALAATIATFTAITTAITVAPTITAVATTV